MAKLSAYGRKEIYRHEFPTHTTVFMDDGTILYKGVSERWHVWRKDVSRERMDITHSFYLKDTAMHNLVANLPKAIDKRVRVYRDLEEGKGSTELLALYKEFKEQGCLKLKNT